MITKKQIRERGCYWFTTYILNFMKWVVSALAIGFVGGGVGTLFHELINYVTVSREENTFLFLLLPFAGLLIVFCYHRLGLRNDRGTNLVLESVHSEERVPFRLTPLIFIGTLLTHLCGGSAGREGAALQIGGSLGYTFGKVFRFDEKDKHILVMCGMSAVFTAMFGTPLTATIFSMEVVSVGIVYYSAFVPCIVAASAAYGMTKLFHVEAVEYAVEIGAYGLTPSVFTKVIILAMACGIVSILFCIALHQVTRFSKKWMPNDYFRIFVGGCGVIALTFLAGTNIYQGAGTSVIEQALGGNAPPLAFIWKILFTAVTIGMGFKGGEIVPTLFIGATFGCFMGPILGMDPSYTAAIGMVCMFCAVVNCPIASILLGIELFATTDVLLLAVACGISYVFSGYYSLYSSQRIMYSKTRSEFINIKSK